MIEKTYFQSLPCGCVVKIDWNSEIGVYGIRTSTCVLHERPNPEPAEAEGRSD